MLGEAAQDYLKAIWKLGQDGRATTSAIADELGVSPASATGMLKRLASLGLVEHERYHGASLTLAGERVALEVVRHHRLLELYLMEALGLGWDEVHAEADRLEHHLSEEVEARIDAALGFPKRDPHGDPIPSAELELVTDPARTLGELRARRRGSDPLRARLGSRAPALSRRARAVPRAARDDRRARARSAGRSRSRSRVLGTRSRSSSPIGSPSPRDGDATARTDVTRDRPGKATETHEHVVVSAATALPGEARVLAAAERSLSGERKGIRSVLPFLGPAFIAAVAYVDPGNFATNVAGGRQVRLPAGVGDRRREPDGDGDPVDEREARYRDRPEPARSSAASGSGDGRPGFSGCRPRRSRWPPTSPSSSAQPSASTCCSASRSSRPG